jgi:hypothetical protein
MYNISSICLLVRIKLLINIEDLDCYILVNKKIQIHFAYKLK